MSRKNSRCCLFMSFNCHRRDVLRLEFTEKSKMIHILWNERQPVSEPSGEKKETEVRVLRINQYMKLVSVT